MIAFHNSFGGFIVFGVTEIIKDTDFSVTGVGEHRINSAKLRDTIKNYCGKDIRFSLSECVLDNKTLQVVGVWKRSLGESPIRLIKNGPEDSKNKSVFKKNEVVFRRTDCNAIATTPDDYDFLHSPRRSPSIELWSGETKPEPLENNLPDRSLICSTFIGRSTDIGSLWAWLADDYSRVRLIAGEGGLGKTSLAYKFSEQLASRKTEPFSKVLWITAKKKQFIPSKDQYRESAIVDYWDADSLYMALCKGLGCVESDFESLDSRELLQLALDTLSKMPAFVVIDDVDSLTKNDQTRVLEFGMRMPQPSKALLTTRVNFSYSSDNVLELSGLSKDDFLEYIRVLRAKYQLAPIKDSVAQGLLKVTSGSPLFSDSLLRLEKRGLPLDQAIGQWKGEKGLEARKAALQREVQQLSKAAKRVLFVICTLRECSYVELSQVFNSYTEQSLGDAIHELSGLFLISAPPLAKEARFKVDPNTAILVAEISDSLGIDHSALQSEIKRSRSDAIGLGIQSRSNKVGLAISQANAKIKNSDIKGALITIAEAAKGMKQPHPDLLLASGRCMMKLSPPQFDSACKDFEESYKYGQRKGLLFDLWFLCEFSRNAFTEAIEVATNALAELNLDSAQWFENRAKVFTVLARRSSRGLSADSFSRECDNAFSDLQDAKNSTASLNERGRLETLAKEVAEMKKRGVSRK